jgi:hypothetical protein
MSEIKQQILLGMAQELIELTSARQKSGDEQRFIPFSRMDGSSGTEECFPPNGWAPIERRRR